MLRARGPRKELVEKIRGPAEDRNVREDPGGATDGDKGKSGDAKKGTGMGKKKKKKTNVGRDWNAEKGLDSLPRFGFALTLPKSWSSVSWYGKGPFESYVDRQAGARVGRYEQTVSEMFFPYIRPQETGNRAGVRWAVVSNGQYSIMATPAGQRHREIHFSALHYTPESLSNGTAAYKSHNGDLYELDLTVLHIDELQAGLGGIDSWGKTALQQYLIPPTDRSYSFWLSPFKGKKTPDEVIAARPQCIACSAL